MRIQCEINAAIPSSQRTNLFFSNGWVSRFEIRNGLRFYRSHRKYVDAEEDAIRIELPSLRARLAKYSINDTFNADEFGIYYKLAPNFTIGPGRLKGRKKEKKEQLFLPA